MPNLCSSPEQRSHRNYLAERVDGLVSGKVVWDGNVEGFLQRPRASVKMC